MPASSNTDCLVLGGGIVGLSLAYQLAADGLSVRLLDRGPLGRQASWAGAGILPPGSWFSSHEAMTPVAALSRRLHPRWSEALREETGVDDEHEVTGAFYATQPDLPTAERRHLAERLADWSTLGIEHERLVADQLAAREPSLTPVESVHVPGEAQVRNPRRLSALAAACERRGVSLHPNTAADAFVLVGDRIESVRTREGVFSAGVVCFATGAWTGQLAEKIDLRIPTTPIRGQIALLRCAERPFRSVVHWGGQYLVPRRDGRVLVGATVEDAGFDTTPRQAATDELVAFAHEAAPCLAEAEVETSWAGLRPASGDGLPIIGRLPPLANAWGAAGHFRSGLQFSPATAVVVSQLIRGVEAAFDVSPFDPARFAAGAPSA